MLLLQVLIPPLQKGLLIVSFHSSQNIALRASTVVLSNNT